MRLFLDKKGLLRNFTLNALFLMLKKPEISSLMYNILV